MLYKKNLVFLLVLVNTGCGSPFNKMRYEVTANTDNEQTKPLTNRKLEISNYYFSVLWLNGPFGDPSKTSALSVSFYNRDLEPTSLPHSYKLFLTADMGMGHGLADRGFFETQDQKTFLNQEIRFYMSGNYKITLYIYDGEKEIGRTTWSYSF